MAVDYNLHKISSAVVKTTSNIEYYGCKDNRTIVDLTLSVSYKDEKTFVSKNCFQSTSAMFLSGSSLPLAAATGTKTTYDNSIIIPTGPKRARPEDNNDPYLNPIGDAILPLLLFAMGYVVIVARKNHLTGLNK